jgi:mono/diheme cytochrome c family protein
MRVIMSLVVGAALATTLAAQTAQQQHEHPATGGTHRHMDAANTKNPVKADATSIAAGKQLYDKQCAACHGETGKGDGKMAAQVNPKPSDLSDADWKHGSTDGELYLVIHDGAKNTAMKPYASKLTEHQIWDVVNYVRTLGPTKSH